MTRSSAIGSLGGSSALGALPVRARRYAEAADGFQRPRRARCGATQRIEIRTVNAVAEFYERPLNYVT